MAQTEEFMFQIVAFRPTVYRIGLTGRSQIQYAKKTSSSPPIVLGGHSITRWKRRRGGHCVLKWDFKQTFPGNQDATLEEMSKFIFIRFY